MRDRFFKDYNGSGAAFKLWVSSASDYDMKDDYFCLELNDEPDSQDIWRHSSASALQMNCEFGRGNPAGSDVAAWSLGQIDILSGSFARLAMSPLADGSSPWLCVKLVIQGSMYIEQGSQRRRAGPGEIVLVESTRPYCQAFDEPTQMIGLRFPTCVLKERGLRHNLRGLIIPDKSAADVRAIGEMIVSIGAQRGGTSTTLRRRQGDQLLDLVDLLIDDPSALIRARSGDATLHRAKHFIARNLRNPRLTAPIIASAVCISNAHLSRLFRADGQPLMTYLWESRLALAADMLKRSNGRVQIGEIAYRCGFASHAHFSRAFKKRHGVTPREVIVAVDRKSSLCTGQTSECIAVGPIEVGRV